MKRQVLKFDDIKGMLNDDEMKGIVGGCGQFYDGHTWYSGEDPKWGSGNQFAGGPGAKGIGGNPSSRDHILNGSDSGPSQAITVGAFASWAMTQPQGTYTNEGNGNYSYSGEPLIKNDNGNTYVSYDNGGTWQGILNDGVNITTGANSNLLADIWNSDVMRGIIPDLISYNVSASAVFGVGVGRTFSINLVTRGEASLSLTETLSARFGLHGDLSGNASSGW